MHRIDSPTEVDTVTAWMADGNCRNYPPAVFFPSDGVGVDRARKICTDCPVATQCLEYALEERIEHGVWGGCSERERRRILKRRRVANLRDTTPEHALPAPGVRRPVGSVVEFESSTVFSVTCLTETRREPSALRPDLP